MFSKLYHEFCRHWDRPLAVDNFLNAVIEFNSWDDWPDLSQECLRISNKFRGLHYGCGHPCITNGSTGPPTLYSFGPNRERIRLRIESFLRGSHYDRWLFLYDRPYFVRSSSILEKGHGQVLYLSLEDPNQFLDFLKLLDTSDEPLTIISTPHVWLYIASHVEASQQFYDRNPIITHVVNSDWPLLKTPDHLRVRDQMIDWLTGVNFFQCEHGKLHPLPIFVLNGRTSRNLLNLMGAFVPLRDSFDLVQNLCPCGRNMTVAHYCPQGLVSLPAIDLCPTGQYYNLQFIMEGEKTHILYIGDTRSDQSVWKAAFGDILLYPNTYCRIGNKLYSNWVKNSVIFTRHTDRNRYAKLKAISHL